MRVDLAGQNQNGKHLENIMLNVSKSKEMLKSNTKI